MQFLKKLECDTGDKIVKLTPTEWANGSTLYAFKIADGLIGPGTYCPALSRRQVSACIDLICSGRELKHQGDRVLSNAWQDWVIPTYSRHRTMSVNRLYAGEINCLVPRLLVDVRWLGVFARVQLADISCEICLWWFILNTDSKDKPGTHWLALYASRVGLFEFFDSFGLLPSTYNLESIQPLHLLYSFQSPSTFVCGHYCIIYVYLRSRNKSPSQICHLLSNI